MFSSLDACIAAFVKAEETTIGLEWEENLHIITQMLGQYCPHIGLFKHTGGSSPQMFKTMLRPSGTN